MTKPLPIIAAIPNYNMATGLDRLLPRLTDQHYDAIYVLDDASTDNSKEIVAKYPSVHWVTHAKNTGSSGARNLIIPHLTEPTIIHFMDADVIPLTDNMPEKIRAIDFNGTLGIIGGLILDKHGRQSKWNYGPRLGSVAAVTTLTYTLFYPLSLTRLGTKILQLYSNRPTAKTSSHPPHPYWLLEGNIIIQSDLLKKYGPFDERLREHDIQPLAAALYKAGFHNEFTRSIAVQHIDDIHVRHYFRFFKLIKSELYVARKHIGFSNWLFSLKRWH